MFWYPAAAGLNIGICLVFRIWNLGFSFFAQ
jgi:hypothetical protein